MMMKRLIAICFAALMQLASQAQEKVVVDANVTPRTLQGQFDNVKVSGNINLVLSQSNAVSLAVSASEEKYTGDISTIVENGTLRIFWSGSNSWTKNRKLTVYLGFNQISAIAATGASNVIVVGAIRQDELKIDLSGASNMVATLDLLSFTISLSGASEAKLDGNVRQLTVNSSGASDVNAYGLEAEICSASASGASDLKLKVYQELNAVASGASHIYYKGDAPKVNIKNSGVSKIESRN